MSWKTFFLFIIIIFLGVFIYLKVQIMGNPNSSFNQSTRFSLGTNPWFRTILGLHNSGDAREEFLSASGPIAIEWYQPETDNIDQSVINNFAAAVTKYTGRQTVTNMAGSVGDSVTPLASLDSFVLKADGEKPPGSSLLTVVFTSDYSPRVSGELSTTYQESGIVLSLAAYQSFLQSYPQNLDNYLLSGLLQGFGSQIGLPFGSDLNCIMDHPVGTNGEPVETIGATDPQDFCPAEQQAIEQLKTQY